MIKAILFDFSRVLLFPKKGTVIESLNGHHREMSKQKDYKFFDHFELNEELLEFLEKIKDKYTLYIFTSETIQETPEVALRIEKIFKKVFSGLRMGLDKKGSESYGKL